MKDFIPNKNYMLEKKLFIIASILVLVSCVSVEKHNHLIEKKISIKKINQDIGFVQKKINRLHPSADWYISHEALSFKFDSLKKTIQAPLKPNELFMKLSPIVASVRQGHMSMQPLIKKLNKQESKLLSKKGTGPISQFDFVWHDQKMYIQKNNSSDSTILKGSRVISINNTKPEELFSKYVKTFTSDGFNQTFYAHRFQKTFNQYFTLEHGIQDSLNYVLEYQNNQSTKVVYRKKNKVEQKAKDSISSNIIQPKNKIALKIKKDSIREVRKQKLMYGYDSNTNKFVKSLSFHEKDSTVAILKLMNFSQGNYRMAFATIFEEIEYNQVKTLILDLRNNPGGRINDAEEIYAYLATEPFQFLQRTKVTSRTSVAYNSFRGTPNVLLAFISPFIPIVSTLLYFKTTKDDDGNTYFKLKNENLKQPKVNHFKGKVYVLINGGSFSASCILSANLKGSQRAIFVGEETGGTFNGTVAGRMPVFKTPHAKLPIRMGLMDIRTTYQLDNHDRGVFPDVEIIPTLEDKINDIDPEMNWVLEDLGILQKTSEH